MQLALTLPFTGVNPALHDAVISSLRAQYVDPAVTVEFRSRPQGATAMVASRAPAAAAT